jgi:hypothetical protein
MDGDGSGAAQHDIGARENEGITHLAFDSHTNLSWDASVEPTALFNLYRGDMAILRDTGDYVQDIGTVPGAWRWCDLASPATTDSDEPGEDWQLFFYLVVLNSSVEGTLGFDGELVERPFTEANRCP